MQLETVKVVSPVSDDNPLGYIVINKTDLTDEHELFDEDGAKKEPAAKALTVEQLKAALADKGIAIPDGAKKADLQALLDKANEG
ncbi:HeH/LEM domain-containing protein [Pandoraea sp. SD6-2]|uniref:HeH/LEM domain-containing protein n=1 Tax=Pandoraea sp. SD6-2 TaxID=1286093 RepID=UPI00032E14D7|nr:HeH/LEM domain-containing protein [Pandoraea sp. SD6-2]EON13148.1 hypothetical protein C266_14089 [Pandoraea sp. SD6-2]